MKSMARPANYRLIRAYLVTGGVMLVLGIAGLLCSDDLNAVFFGAFFPAIIAGGIAYSKGV